MLGSALSKGTGVAAKKAPAKKVATKRAGKAAGGAKPPAPKGPDWQARPYPEKPTPPPSIVALAKQQLEQEWKGHRFDYVDSQHLNNVYPRGRRAARAWAVDSKATGKMLGGPPRRGVGPINKTGGPPARNSGKPTTGRSATWNRELLFKNLDRERKKRGL